MVWCILRYLTVVLFSTAFLDACGGDTKTGANGPVYGPGWSAVHADASNSDFSPLEGARRLELTWERDFSGGDIFLGPTSDDQGRVYVTTNAPGCHVYALDQRTGETVWCSERVNPTAIASSPLLDNEGHLFLADNTAMFAFDTATGDVLWETPIVGFTLSAQFTPSGRIIFVTHIGRIYVLDRGTGQPVLPPIDLIAGAAYDPASPDQPTLACMLGTRDCPAANTIAVDRKGRFFFTFFPPEAPQAELRAMEYSEDPKPSIAPLWTNESLPGGSGSSPDISADGTRLYVNDNVDSLHSIDAATGETIWSFALGWASGGSPSTSPEGVIIPTGGPLLAIVDRGDHAELLWRDDYLNRSIATQAAGHIAYPAVAAAGRTPAENDVLVIDTQSGAVLDRVPLPGSTVFIVGTTIGPDGSVFVPTFNGRLFAFRPAGALE
jgi:outer membrane protein assembly factor BamB